MNMPGSDDKPFALNGMGEEMKSSIFYRISAIFLLLFAVGHTLGFSQVDPKWGLDAPLNLLRTTRFDADGFSRTYWEFFLATGYISGLFYLFSAVLSWQLGGLSGAELARLRGVTWGLALCFAVVSVVSWTHLFLIPIVFSVGITLCLTLAAWLAGRQST